MSVEREYVRVHTETHVVQDAHDAGDNVHDAEEDSWNIATELMTDSQSAIDLLRGQDLPRRSRHVEIRLAWMRAKMATGRLSLHWLAGSVNPADLFTKSVNTALLLLHRRRSRLRALNLKLPTIPHLDSGENTWYILLIRPSLFALGACGLAERL